MIALALPDPLYFDLYFGLAALTSNIFRI